MKTIAFVRAMHNNDRTVHHYCGYVGISNNDVSVINNKLLKTMDDEDKEWLEYDAIASKLKVHGGITFSSSFSKNTPIIPITAIPDNWHEYHYYGFDLNHYNNNETGVSTNIDYAIKETLAIQKQLEELIAQYVPSTGN